jgi:hypothetical protein
MPYRYYGLKKIFYGINIIDVDLIMKNDLEKGISKPIVVKGKSGKSLKILNGFVIKPFYRCLIRFEDLLLVHQGLQGLPSARC